MILKVHRGLQEDDGWVYFDEIDEFVLRRVLNSEAQTIKAETSFVFVEDLNPANDPTVNVYYLTQRGNCRIILGSAGGGFLLNNNGKTIERL